VSAAAIRAFKGVNRLPLYLQVAEQIRQAIMAGDFAPGDELPTERELGETFGVSRASVREALRSLRAEGLILSTGAPARSVVTDAVDQPAREALVNLMRLRGVALEDLVDLRCLLETAALEAAADNPAPKHVAEARKALETMQASELDIESFDAADIRFHTALVRASGNEAMHLVMLALRQPVEQHLFEALQAEADPAETLTRLTDEHAAILDAVEAGDGDRAAKLVERHIRGFYGARSRRG
jgi:GntR family transcriptional repressor for pyruvate dehydrogenase complex